jgi:adenylate kinase
VQLEKEWVKLMKTQCYRSYIIFPGLIYHAGESVFHSMLKSAWHGQDIVVYGDGANYLPMVHLFDLCELMIMMIERPSAEWKYILAVDDSRVTYMEIAKVGCSRPALYSYLKFTFYLFGLLM